MEDEMIPAVVITGLVELAKLGLQIYFMSLQTAGKTQEEMLELYKSQQEYFLAHHYSTLPDME